MAIIFMRGVVPTSGLCHGGLTWSSFVSMVCPCDGRYWAVLEERTTCRLSDTARFLSRTHSITQIQQGGL